MITYLEGDATEPYDDGRRAMIVHVCNDAGGFGKGFAAAIAAKWPQVRRDYRLWYANDRAVPRFELGQIQTVALGPEGDLFRVSVINMIAQHGYRQRYSDPVHKFIDYQALSNCLRYVSTLALALNDVSIHMPRIGCGLAGGSWTEVEPIVQRLLVNRGLPVFVYDLPND